MDHVDERKMQDAEEERCNTFLITRLEDINDIFIFSETNIEYHHPWALFLQWFIGRQYNDGRSLKKLIKKNLILKSGYEIQLKEDIDKESFAVYITLTTEKDRPILAPFEIYSSNKNERKNAFKELCMFVTHQEYNQRDLQNPPLYRDENFDERSKSLVNKIETLELLKCYPDESNGDFDYPPHHWALLLQWLLGRNYQFVFVSSNTNYMHNTDQIEVIQSINIYLTDDSENDRHIRINFYKELIDDKVEYRVIVIYILSPDADHLPPPTYSIYNSNPIEQRRQLRMLRNYITSICEPIPTEDEEEV